MPTAPSHRGRAVLARLAYVGVICLATLTGLAFDPSLADVPPRLQRALILVPHFFNPPDWIDGARNVLLFLGFGAVWVATSRLVRPWLTILRVTVIGCLLSMSVETVQLFSPLRNSSLFDVSTNTLGALLGAWGTFVLLRAVQRRRGTRMYIGMPAGIFALAYATAIAAEAFFPLLREPTLPNVVSGIRSRIAEGLAAFDASTLLAVPVTDLFLYLPVGVFAVAAAAEAGIAFSTAWPVVAIFGAIVMAALEVVHAVALEPVNAGALAVHVVAITLGAILAVRALPRFAKLGQQERPLFALGAYAVLVAMWSWRPFRLELSAQAMAEQFTREHVIPLAALAIRGDLFSVTDVVAQCLLFVPIGALLAVWPLRRSGFLRKMLPAVYLSVVLEVGKIAVADRFMDVTHILIQCAGAGIGYALMRLAGFRPYGELLGSPVAPPASRRAR